MAGHWFRWHKLARPAPAVRRALAAALCVCLSLCAMPGLGAAQAQDDPSDAVAEADAQVVHVTPDEHDTRPAASSGFTVEVVDGWRVIRRQTIHNARIDLPRDADAIIDCELRHCHVFVSGGAPVLRDVRFVGLAGFPDSKHPLHIFGADGAEFTDLVFDNTSRGVVIQAHHRSVTRCTFRRLLFRGMSWINNGNEQLLIEGGKHAVHHNTFEHIRTHSSHGGSVMMWEAQAHDNHFRDLRLGQSLVLMGEGAVDNTFEDVLLDGGTVRIFDGPRGNRVDAILIGPIDSVPGLHWVGPAEFREDKSVNAIRRHHLRNDPPPRRLHVHKAFGNHLRVSSLAQLLATDEDQPHAMFD